MNEFNFRMKKLPNFEDFVNEAKRGKVDYSNLSDPNKFKGDLKKNFEHFQKRPHDKSGWLNWKMIVQNTVEDIMKKNKASFSNQEFDPPSVVDQVAFKSKGTFSTNASVHIQGANLIGEFTDEQREDFYNETLDLIKKDLIAMGASIDDTFEGKGRHKHRVLKVMWAHYFPKEQSFG